MELLHFGIDIVKLYFEGGQFSRMVLRVSSYICLV